MPTQPMSKEAASRIQSTQDKGGKDVGAGSFASRSQSAGDRNTNTQGQANNTGQKK